MNWFHTIAGLLGVIGTSMSTSWSGWLVTLAFLAILVEGFMHKD